MNILKTLFKYLTGQQFTLYMDGGGGGGSGTGTQTQISELPEWARGYAKSALEKGAALSETPYQKYDAPRIAGFSPLQLQSQQGAANMQTNVGTGMGMGLAGAAALGGLNQDYQGGQFQGGQFGNQQAAQYMSPYIQEAMEPQLREAARASALQSQQNAAGAVGKGAFGGSRQALVEAERQRNLATQQGDIRAKGYQTAYEQAANQFNQDSSRGLTAQQLGEQSRQFGANLGLQGLNTALQGAGQLGTLGQQQFQQGMDINKLQNAYGGQEQALRQQGLSQAYSDFQNEQNYPYKQLGFFSDLIRGIPVGQATTKTMYEPDPSMLQQVGAAGAGLYGLSKFMAEGGMAYADGGEIEGYAGDNGSVVGDVDSRENVEKIVRSLRGNPEALKRAYQAAQARGDRDQMEAIESEMAIAASLRNGLASAVTPQMAEGFAGGGILAFQDRGAVDSEEESTSRDYVGIPNQAALKEWLASQKAISEFKPSKAMTKEDRAAMDQENFERFQKFAGADPYAPMAERIKGMSGDLEAQRERGKGAIALSMIPKLLRPGSQSRAFGEAVGTAGEGLSALDAAQSREKRALASMDFNLADAQRKERMGLTKDAISSTESAAKDRIAADRAALDALKARAKGATDAGRAFRTTGTGAGGAGKGPKIAEQLAAAEIAYEKNPTDEALKTVTALRRAMIQTKTTDVGTQKAELARAQILSNENGKVQAAMNKFQFNPKYLEAEARGQGDAVWKAELEKQRSLFPTSGAPLPVNRNSGNNTPPPPEGFTPN